MFIPKGPKKGDKFRTLKDIYTVRGIFTKDHILILKGFCAAGYVLIDDDGNKCTEHFLNTDEYEKI